MINQEVKSDLEEAEYSAPISIEEKVATNDKKQQEALDPAKGSSREAYDEIKKVEAMTSINEVGDVKAKSVRDDKPSYYSMKRMIQLSIKLNHGYLAYLYYTLLLVS